jgi:replicative DNA helicase Mcm
MVDEPKEENIPERINQDEFLADAKEFFEMNRKDIGEVKKRGDKIVHIDFEDFSAHSPQLAEQLLDRPEETVQLLEVALEELEWAPNDSRARFISISKSQEILIRNIRAKHLGKMVSIEGIVRKASEVRPLVTNAKFECPSCGTIISVLQIEKKFKEPSRCSCGRRGGFKEISKHMVDAQALTIEEASDNLSGGEQPKRMNIFLKEDLVDPKMEMRTTPGSRVMIIGILKEIALSSSSGAVLTRFDLAIEANNVIPLEESFEDVDISEEDERAIRELAADPQIMDKMVGSIAPSIWGQSEEKRALAFQLFGGVKKQRSDGTKMRGDIHILLVGDPGVAKSVMLGFISGIAPKARYVSGKSATGAGLTATVVKDELLKGWSLEAGAMVLANKGLICIDEFDKMDEEDRSTMHEAMEQQCMMPDFKLMLSNGRNVKIGEFVDDLVEKNPDKICEGKDCEILDVDNVELISTDFQNHFPMKAARVSRHLAPEEFVEIKLSNGKDITVTPEHPCWIVEDGKIKTIPAEKLNSKMFFPIPSRIDIKTKAYEKKNDYLCKILGYHISDGCYELNRGKKNGIQFWNNDKKLIEDYKNSIEKYFGIKPAITRRGKQMAVRVVSRKVVEEFIGLDSCLMEKCCHNKIPESIMSLPNENIRYLIRSLFDGDGTVVNQARGGCRATLVGENREMLEQVSDLLLRFEIQSSIFRDESSNVWRLDISGQENLGNFLMRISFLSEHKKSRLKSYCEKNKTYRTIKDLIPGCTNKISEIYKKLGISMRKELGHSIDLGVEKQRKHLQKLVLIAEKYLNGSKKQESIVKDLGEIKKLAFGYARWMKVKSVSKIANKGVKWVYDVTIEPHHTFISNGMILHNTVTISKATVQATLRSQTAVLAAANPKFGRFDPTQSIPKQVNLPPSLLSRFDCIFIMRDIPSKDRDESIAMHVLMEHKQDTKHAVKHDVIDRELLRKYVSYAKQKYDPILTDEAVAEMKSFYVGLRNQPQLGDSPNRPIPIGARQLEALVRLAEAHARIRLSKKVTKKDALAAIDLVKGYLMQVGYDEETKTIDIDKISGNPASKRNKISIIREAVEALENRLGKLIPVEELEKELKEKMSDTDFEEALGKMVKAGDLFRPKRGYIQRM